MPVKMRRKGKVGGLRGKTETKGWVGKGQGYLTKERLQRESPVFERKEKRRRTGKGGHEQPLRSVEKRGRKVAEAGPPPQTNRRKKNHEGPSLS